MTLVDRLRAWYPEEHWRPTQILINEAADEIEQQKAMIRRQQLEIARLKELLHIQDVEELP